MTYPATLNTGLFEDLNTSEKQAIDGGALGFIAGVLTGVVATFVYSVADTYVKEETGSTISEHTVSAARDYYDFVDYLFTGH